MASRRVHVALGVPSGIGAAAYAARQQTGNRLIIESVGGGVGGYVGALLPDILEPAVSSWHRSTCHSWAVVGIAVQTVPDEIRRWQEYCRAQAAHHERQRDTSQDSVARTWHGACAMFWLLAAGFAAGLAAGYASHLVLDATTARGLPLI
jgi:hypothetical protein